MVWRKHFVSSWMAHGEFNAWFVTSRFGKVTMALMLAVAVGLAIRSSYKQSELQEAVRSQFIERCDASTVTDCEERLELNGAKCFNAADFDHATGINLEQHYHCTIKSYPVWSAEYRAEKRKNEGPRIR